MFDVKLMGGKSDAAGVAKRLHTGLCCKIQLQPLPRANAFIIVHVCLRMVVISMLAWARGLAKQCCVRYDWRQYDTRWVHSYAHKVSLVLIYHATFTACTIQVGMVYKYVSSVAHGFPVVSSKAAADDRGRSSAMGSAQIQQHAR
jgi:hypothetical protein